MLSVKREAFTYLLLPLPLTAPDFLSCRCKPSRSVWSFLFLHIQDTQSTTLQGQQLYQHCPLWLGALFSCSEVWDLPAQDTHELRDKKKSVNWRWEPIHTTVIYTLNMVHFLSVYLFELSTRKNQPCSVWGIWLDRILLSVVLDQTPSCCARNESRRSCVLPLSCKRLCANCNRKYINM